VFKPQGIPVRSLEFINMTVEELEAMRLADIEEMYQEDAAEKMGISRPTYHRILREARRKVASAIVGGKALCIEGGDYVLSPSARILECIECGYRWEENRVHVRACEVSCPKCGGNARRIVCKSMHPGRFGATRARFRGGAQESKDEESEVE